RPHPQGVRDPGDAHAPRRGGREPEPHRRVRLAGRPERSREPRGRARQPPAPQDRPRRRSPAPPHRALARLPPRRSRGMKRLSFRSRLSLWLTAAVACLLAVATFAAHWALARLVLGQLDAALVALAETEASALVADVRSPVRVHELGPGVAPPSFVRLD